MNLDNYIRVVNDFPKPGIPFKDITPLIGDPAAFGHAIYKMSEPYYDLGATKVIGAEARGFIFGAAIAEHLNIGFVPARKPGKLPYEVVSEEYDLEYGTDSLSVHSDAVRNDERVILVDDVLATGGTMTAMAKLVEKIGADIIGISFLMELDYLNGRENISKYNINSVLHY
jgi:adenine phosphoribosyltransferase